jgi:hypothetical protein
MLLDHLGGVKGRENGRIGRLAKDLEEDVQKQSFSESMGFAAEQFREHMLVRVEVFQIAISEHVRRHADCERRSISCFSRSEASFSSGSPQK